MLRFHGNSGYANAPEVFCPADITYLVLQNVQTGFRVQRANRDF
jgi:hypothetical protein